MQRTRFFSRRPCAAQVVECSTLTRLWFILGDVNTPKHADPRQRQFFCSFLRASRSLLSFLSPTLIPAAIPPLAITLSLALALAISLKACAPSDGSTAATAASTSAAAPSSVMRTPIVIPPRATIDEAWSIIGTAIVDNDTLTFRAYSTPEVYGLVVRPRDINGTQAVVIASHWDIIAGRRTGFYEDSHDLPKTPAPGSAFAANRHTNWRTSRESTTLVFSPRTGRPRTPDFSSRKWTAHGPSSDSADSTTEGQRSNHAGHSSS